MLSELAVSQMMNMIRTLSAVFDANNGQITIDKNILDKAGSRFYLTARVDGNKVVLTKFKGESELYKQAKKAVN